MTDFRTDLRGEQTQSLAARAAALDEAVTLGGDRLPSDEAEAARGVLDRVRQRLALGVDHTVVALVGGTGSGKSSLFNRISGLDFADVGVRRPTTSAVTACVWGTDTYALLDWLGVDGERRIERESLLDGESEASLRGLVLLDLPDHDSIEPGHREVVDAILPQADLLVWVVDPQKYADDALHSGYLRTLVGHDASMLVLLNHLDTVREPERAGLLADVARLVADDGLPGVPVRGISARTGEGVGELRDALAAAVATRSLAARRAGAEVGGAARRLSLGVAERDPAPAALSTAAWVDDLAGAVGLEAVADAVSAAVRGRGAAVPALASAQLDSVSLARSSWLAGASKGLPAPWAQSMHEAVASAQTLADQLVAALGEVTVMVRRSRAALVLTVLSGLLAIGGVALAAVGVGRALGPGRSWVAPVVEGLVVVGAAVVLWLVASGLRRSAAAGQARRVREQGRAAIDSVARKGLAEPATRVVREHRSVRELLEAAQD